jgi:hypothetical protein
MSGRALAYGLLSSVRTSQSQQASKILKLSSAEMHPSAVVIGTDLSPIQPTLSGAFTTQVPVTIIANSTQYPAKLVLHC